MFLPTACLWFAYHCCISTTLGVQVTEIQVWESGHKLQFLPLIWQQHNCSDRNNPYPYCLKCIILDSPFGIQPPIKRPSSHVIHLQQDTQEVICSFADSSIKISAMLKCGTNVNPSRYTWCWHVLSPDMEHRNWVLGLNGSFM